MAAAIRSCPDPFLSSLRGAGVGLPVADARVRATTQVGVRDAGIIDLVLSVEGGFDAKEIWVEVKCHAGESGVQLANYTRVISSRPPGLQPTLVLLSPKALATSVEVPIVTWESVWRAARSHREWSDLRLWLEEHRMVDQFETAPTTREACVQRDAHALLRKVERSLLPVMAHAKKAAPLLKWPDTQKRVRRYLLKNFGDWGAMSVSSRLSRRFGVSVGAFVDLETQESRAGVRVWNLPKLIHVRRGVLERLGSQQLPSAWTRSPGEEEKAPSRWIASSTSWRRSATAPKRRTMQERCIATSSRRTCSS